MKERFYYSIASGSTGNCGLYRDGEQTVLIDLGVSVRRLKKALAAIGMMIEDLDAVIITHEHTDHVKGLQTLLRRYRVPVYATHATVDHLALRVPEVTQAVIGFHGGESFAVGGLQIQSFLTPHDAAESVGYVLRTKDTSFGYATDLGFMPTTIRSQLLGCDTVVLESNHDVHMLKTGPYPWPLKQRVAGARGHLSNADCALCACELVQAGTKTLILAHLSEQNNTPLTAFRQTRAALDEMELPCDLYVAPKEEMECPIVLLGREMGGMRMEGDQVCCL